MLTNTNDLIADFVRVATLSGLSIVKRDIAHETLRAPHTQPTLPDNSQAVYVFSLSNPPFTVLKVGKVGPNSNARFQSQHYNPNMLEVIWQNRYSIRRTFGSNWEFSLSMRETLGNG